MSVSGTDVEGAICGVEFEVDGCSIADDSELSSSLWS